MATSIFREYFKGYEILGELGRGNARVLKARSMTSGQLVAIKHFAFNTDPDTLRRFQRESEIMKSITHHHIVEIIDVHLDAELPYIVMQLIEGGDLRSLLKKNHRLDLATVTTLAAHMTDALATIHEKAIVHRDIKPENIMYRQLANGELQFLLTDFGIARLREQADAITVTGASMLTYDYASPEQFSQPRSVTAATDYYSLGVVLYECLAGAVPFEYEQDDLLLHINRVISAPVPPCLLPNSQSPPAGMLQLLEALLRKQPSKRLCNPGSVQLLLQKAASGESADPALLPGAATLPYHGPLPAPAPKTRRRFAWPLLLLLLCIGLFFSWINRSGYPRKIFPGTNSATVSTPAINAKQVLLPQAAHAVNKRHAPAVNGENAQPIITDPGTALVNGMYYNDFDQQDSVWNTGRDDNSEFVLLDGKYTMKGFNDSLSYSSFIKLNMDTEKDFTIAATATHEGEGSSDPFGIIFCGDENHDAFFVFYITSNGYYSIGTSVKDQWNALTDWTASSNIHPDNEMNIFSIERRAETLRFLVNGRLEKVLPFTRGFGNYFGLRTDGTQTVAFDEFIVKGSSPTYNP